MTNNTDSPTEVEIGSYLTAYLYRVPKKNHDVITQNLKKFIPWFEKNGVRLEYYNLAGRETQEVVDSSKVLEWRVWKVLPKLLGRRRGHMDGVHYFRDHSHCKEVYAKMMTDRSLEPLLNEFFGLITQGRGLITGGFNRLRH